MTSEPANSTPGSPETKGEPWSLVSVAFGAVLGTVISVLIQPLVDLLPGRLFEEFLNSFIERVLSFALPVLLAFAAARIRRLDQFLRRYLSGAALVAALLLGFSLWVHAGKPVLWVPIAAVALTMVETWLFLLFCGGAVQTGLMQIRGKQEEEYTKQREADAQEIAAEAIAMGDPAIAAGIFGTNAMEGLGKAFGFGCLVLVLSLFHLLMIWTISTVDTHLLFHLSLLWSVVAGLVIMLAAISVVLYSQEFGEQHSQSIALDEKYKGIGPKR